MLIPNNKRVRRYEEALNAIIYGEADNFFKTYGLNERVKKTLCRIVLMKWQEYHVYNWLYTVRVETGYSGQRLCEHLLWTLKDTLDRHDWEADNTDFHTVKTLISILLIKIYPKFKQI